MVYHEPATLDDALADVREIFAERRQEIADWQKRFDLLKKSYQDLQNMVIDLREEEALLEFLTDSATTEFVCPECRGEFVYKPESHREDCPLKAVIVKLQERKNIRETGDAQL